jgi:hypothetical protein
MGQPDVATTTFDLVQTSLVMSLPISIPQRQQALNLGIFYKDTVGKKRWVLKFDDSKMLDQIDAVFVTLEPGGASHKPSGKSLLFAYLKVNSNHP